MNVTKARTTKIEIGNGLFLAFLASFSKWKNDTRNPIILLSLAVESFKFKNS